MLTTTAHQKHYRKTNSVIPIAYARAIIVNTKPQN